MHSAVPLLHISCYLCYRSVLSHSNHCPESSVAVTAGTDFVEHPVGRSVIHDEFRIFLGAKALVAVISFLGTRTNRRGGGGGANRDGKLGEGTQTYFKGPKIATLP